MLMDRISLEVSTIKLVRRIINIGESMKRASQSEKTMRKFPKNWFYVIGLVIILTSEFMLRDVFLPEHAGDIHIGIAILV
ncbi:MAG: hypothetical protein H3Z52_05345 [archaeon]|nr:hypothetical protein [archaeon]